MSFLCFAVSFIVYFLVVHITVEYHVIFHGTYCVHCYRTGNEQVYEHCFLSNKFIVIVKKREKLQKTKKREKVMRSKKDDSWLKFQFFWLHQDSINFGGKVPRKMCDKSLSLNSTRLKISKFNKPVNQKKIQNLKNRLIWAPSENNLLKPSGYSPCRNSELLRITLPKYSKTKTECDWILSSSTAPPSLSKNNFGLGSKT